MVNSALTTGVDDVDVADVDGDVVDVDGDDVDVDVDDVDVDVDDVDVDVDDVDVDLDDVDVDLDVGLDFELFSESSASRLASIEIDSIAGLFASILSVSADTTADTAPIPG